MTFASACLYSILGITVVFFALVLLMLIIRVITAVGDAAEKRAVRSAPLSSGGIPSPDVQASVQPLSVTGPVAPGAAGELKLFDTDPRTAAMLMAIVADTMKVPVNELRFLSIREIKEDPSHEV